MSSGENIEGRYRLLVPKVLGRALELLSDRKRWTTGSLARTGNNHTTRPTDPDAEKWCALGAIERCAREVIEAEAGSDRHLHYGVLFQMAQREARPHIVAAGKGPVVKAEADGHRVVEIPQINDRPENGGYLAVVRGLASAVGASLTLSAKQQRQIDRFVARSEAARKGWATRTAKKVAEWERWKAEYAGRLAAQQAQQSSPEPPTMTFGGTLPTTDSTDADTQRKDSPLCATSVA